jgi:hypothetical protein
MGKSQQYRPSGGPTGFVKPTESTQQTPSGFRDMTGDADARTGNDPFSGVPMEPQSSDGYGAEDSPASPGQLGHQSTDDGYSSTLR